MNTNPEEVIERKDNSRKIKIESCIRCPHLYYVEKSGDMKFPKCLLSDTEIEWGNINVDVRKRMEVKKLSFPIPEWCRLKYYNG